MRDSDIEDLYAAPVAHDDAPAFERRVMQGLKVKLWLRQWLVVLAGFIGGVYALAQLVRMPDWQVGGKSAYGRSLEQAAAETDETWRAGVELVDVVRQSSMDLMDASAQYLTYMQTPAFFWVSFSLCLAIVGVYYAYSQEETI
ncbi:hypothetical protein [Asticcacaulis sp. AC402]|uniref:hypothetical protein n=1 Tax=Asticcacaulis sp. AC402 TaxID=1282361 RepID=UPI0003C3F48B|nr:hypothetical protein [Asticcacaulis sp. AC402]ESQ76257.1 hypothetical protein ABAC402_05115 [Asticcacaulis sp. AC402]